MTTLSTNYILSWEMSGKRQDFKVINSGKKYTQLENISQTHKCSPRRYSTDKLLEAIKNGTVKIFGN